MSRNKPKDWEEAKRRCHLNAEEIRMAQKLGMSPRSLLKNIPSPKQRWKQPVKEWVRALYESKFGRREATRPQPVPRRSPPLDEEFEIPF